MKHPRLQTCFSIGIQFLCITFVLWQTWECIVKYTKSPQGTETHVAFTGKVAFPSITVCSSQTGNKNMPYNESILKLCQINSSDYIEHTQWISFSGPELCQDPKKFNEALIQNEQTLVDYIQYDTFDQGMGDQIPLTNSTIWTKIDRNQFGRC